MHYYMRASRIAMFSLSGTAQFPFLSACSIKRRSNLPSSYRGGDGGGGFHLGARVRSLQSASTSRHTIQGNSHLLISWPCPTKPSYHLPSSYRGGAGGGSTSALESGPSNQRPHQGTPYKAIPTCQFPGPALPNQAITSPPHIEEGAGVAATSSRPA